MNYLKALYVMHVVFVLPTALFAICGHSLMASGLTFGNTLLGDPAAFEVKDPFTMRLFGNSLIMSAVFDLLALFSNDKAVHKVRCLCAAVFFLGNVSLAAYSRFAEHQGIWLFTLMAGDGLCGVLYFLGYLSLLSSSSETKQKKAK